MNDDGAVLLNWVNYKLQALSTNQVHSLATLFSSPALMCLLVENALGNTHKIQPTFEALVDAVAKSGLELEREPEVFLASFEEGHITNNVVFLWHIAELFELMPLGLTCGGGALSHTSSDLKGQLEMLTGKRIKRFSPSKLDSVLADLLSSMGIEISDRPAIDVASEIIGYELFHGVDLDQALDEKSFILFLSVVLANRSKFEEREPPSHGRPLPLLPQEYSDEDDVDLEAHDEPAKPEPILLPKLRKRYGEVFCRNISATKYQLIITDTLSQTVALLCLLLGVIISFVFLFVGRATDLPILYAVFAIALLLNSCWAFMAHTYITNFDRRSNTVTVTHSKWFCRVTRNVMDLDALTGAFVDNGAVYLQFGELDFVPITRRGRWHTAFKEKMVDRVELFLKRIRNQLPKPGVKPTFLVAKYDLSPATSGDIPLTAGGLVRVDDQNEEGWWKGRVLVDGQAVTGTFPVNYTAVMHPSEEYLLSKNIKH